MNYVIKRLELELKQPCYLFRSRENRGREQSLAPNIINEALQIRLSEDEYELLKLGPRFIFNDPIAELATLRRKIEYRFFEKKVSAGRPVQLFINELDHLLQKLHSTAIPLNLSSKIKKKNYHRLVKRLKYKFKLTNTILRKTDKSKVFHLRRYEDYERRSEEYMERIQAYQSLDNNDPLPDLIQRTNQYLLQLRLAKWITQNHYEKLCVKFDEVELAHLYYLPKAHKPGTPLRPIISGIKYPTIKISNFLPIYFDHYLIKWQLKQLSTLVLNLFNCFNNGQKINSQVRLYWVQ